MAVQDIITSSRAFAEGYVAQGDALMSRISELADTEIEIPDIDEAPPTLLHDENLNSLLAQLSILPERTGGEVAEQAIPDAPAAPTFTAMETIDIPDFDVGSAPSVTIPAAPTVTALQQPGAAPVFNAPDIPEAPTLTLPTLPTITTLDLPDAPVIELPTFDAVAPDFEISAPTENFAFADQPYQSALLDAVQAKLLADMENGGYGIEPTDEAALWERGREREAQAAEEGIEGMAREFANRGYLVPPGAMFGAIEGIRAKALQASNSQSRDVSLKRADLYVQNRQFTIGQVQQLEGVLINMHMANMERMLNAAKATAEFAIDYYRARLEEQRARLEKYRTEAQVWGERIRAEAQRVDLYRAMIQAEQAKADVDKSRVDLYRAQLAGVEAIVAVYRARLEGANAQAQIERTRLEAYKATVDAYVAGVQARESEFKVYEAQIRGEKAKVEIYGERVKAFTARMDGARTAADIQATRLRSEVEQSNAVLRGYDSSVQAAKTRADVAITEAELSLKGYGIDVDAYRANVGMVTAYGQIRAQALDSFVKLEGMRQNVNLNRAKLYLEKLVAQYDLQAKAGVEGARIYATMIQGALSSITSIASLSE